MFRDSSTPSFYYPPDKKQFSILTVCFSLLTAKRYCVMLQEEKGHLLLNELISYTDSHPDIKLISSQILDTVAGNV
jgi:hypothetical protein